ncbi:MAG: cobalamin-dependent protein [Anaerolineae bacterium]|nr:cobalamin-dependent protein [Anaerolineae bacterium]NUQ05163.1 cobalamin B12-binding domain-containing protein [Anaerolineae bacterium]
MSAVNVAFDAAPPARTTGGRRDTVLLYNPISTSPGKQRLPLSLLAVSAVIAADYDLEFIDGNLTADPAAAIIERAKATGAKLLAVTVMPGPQLRQAVPVCKAVKRALPSLVILWGGYFPTQHYESILRSDCVDYVIAGQGEAPFRQFVEALHHGGSLTDIPSLATNDAGTIRMNTRAPAIPLNGLPWYPYDRLEVSRYVGRSYLGDRVLSHNSSFGCPFACNFCAVVALANRRWIPESGERVANIVQHLHQRWKIDGLEFNDMDFFVQENRTADFAERLAGFAGDSIHWWGLGRIDTLMGYSDRTWETMRRSGLKMVFMGAESGDDEMLKRMNKGGKSGTEMTLALVERMKHYGIVPELSFVLGNPPEPMADIEASIRFIRKLKQINPATELVLYIYTPVPQEGSILLEEATKLGFRFPETLEEWASDEWAKRAMRRDPGTPWFKDDVRRRVRDFETVINAYYPTVTDRRLRGGVRHVLQGLSGWRYRVGYYQWPYELKALQRLIHYRRPETTGF